MGLNSYAKRKGYFVEWQREFRQTDKAKNYEKNYRAKYDSTFDGTVTSLLVGARSRAKKNNLEFDLDREWVASHLKSMKCEVTGVDLVLEIDQNVSHTPFRPSIDRLDNAQGYTKVNSRIVSVIYNKAKSDYTDEDVSKMALSLAAVLQTKPLDGEKG